MPWKFFTSTGAEKVIGGNTGGAGPIGVTGATGATGDTGATSPPSGAAGGDLAGTYPNPTIGPGRVIPSYLATPFVGFATPIGGTSTATGALSMFLS